MLPELTIVGANELLDHPKLPRHAAYFFLGEYLGKQEVDRLRDRGLGLPDGNRLVYDFKMGIDRRGTIEWERKMVATVRIAAAFVRGFDWREITQTKKVALIPIPPSKSRSNPLYDQRMLDVLMWMREITGLTLDVRDCLVFDGVAEASHTSIKRPSDADLFETLNFNLAAGQIGEPPDTIYLFDDVLTTGAHFSAASQLLEKIFPSASIVGVFVVRRRLPRKD